MSETDHTVFEGRKVFHKKDFAEISNTVVCNRGMLQAKEILEKVNNKEKEVVRGKKGRFSLKKRKKETVEARGGRKIRISSSDSEDETLAETGRKTTGSASRTGTTPTKKPPVSSTAGDTTVAATTGAAQSQSRPQSSMDVTSATIPPSNQQHGQTIVETVASSPLKETVIPSPSKVEALLKKLRDEPVRAANYGKNSS